MGTPLFSSNNELVGIAVVLGVNMIRYTIFALVYNDAEFIHEVMNIIPELRE